jgi:predicted nucleotidyltransferase
MRSINKCLELEYPSMMTLEESLKFRKWLDQDARYIYDSCDYCYLLGWYVLGDHNIPLSPKEAGFN